MTNKYTIEQLSINPKKLEEKGYKKYTDRMKDSLTYIGSWQKCIHNDYGKAYFINFNFSDMSYYNKELNNKFTPYSWEADMQFNDLDEEMTINMKIFSSNKNLEDVENFCSKLFKKMQFKNYEYYNDDKELENSHRQELKNDNILENAIKLESELQKNTSNNKKKKI